jgi:GNAT superfamily N-acetyltransferase
VSVVITYLELTDPAGLRPARPPRVQAEVTRVPPEGATSRWFYEHVGADYAWTDHLGRTDAAWQAYAETVETWIATVAGERAGYFELQPDPAAASVQVRYFGLLPAFHGLGLGGHLLTVCLRRGFELAPRVWLHTCSLDGPHALANYKARGLVPFRATR